MALALLLSQWAERINLTAHRSPESAVRRLILDALALGGQLPASSAPSSPPGPSSGRELPGAFDSLVDLGSGAGFPGLPLAVAFPRARYLLVESRERRHHFQRAARRALGVGNVELVLGRAERIEPNPAAIVVAQAAGPAQAVLDWLLAWCRPGGWVAIPFGERAPELPDTDPAHRYVEVQRRRYQVPLGGPERGLWLARRRPAVPDSP